MKLQTIESSTDTEAGERKMKLSPTMKVVLRKVANAYSNGTMPKLLPGPSEQR